jgi:transcriptional regulator with XRE-family HTH domain
VNIIGPKVRHVREIKKLTQEQLVARCNIDGWNISRSTLAKIESQVRRITDIEVKRLATALEIKIQDLFNT